MSKNLNSQPTGKKRIAFVGQPEYFRIHYRDMLYSDEFDCVEIPVKIAIPETYSPLLADEYDYIFFFRGEFCPDSVLNNVVGKKIAISSEPFPKCTKQGLMSSNELWDRFVIFRRIQDLNFDYIFHYDKTSIPWMETEGISVDGEFPLPISKHGFTCPIEMGREWDVCFIGRSNDYRENVLGALKRDFNVIHITHGADDMLCRAIAQCSKIVLNLNTEDIPSYNPRLAQFLSYNSFVISEPLTHRDTFTAGEHYIECKWNEIYDTVKEWVKDENADLRDEMAALGENRVCEKLDCVKCWKELIERIEDEDTLLNA